MMLKKSGVKKTLLKEFILPTLSLLTSLSTLVCCALPVFLVMLGMGATLVSLISLFPWLVIISKYKLLTFTTAGLLLIFSAFIYWKGKNSCPVDEEQAKICKKLRLINFFTLIISTIIFIFGFFFAFLASYFYR